MSTRIEVHGQFDRRAGLPPELELWDLVWGRLQVFGLAVPWFTTSDGGRSDEQPEVGLGVADIDGVIARIEADLPRALELSAPLQAMVAAMSDALRTMYVVRIDAIDVSAAPRAGLRSIAVGGAAWSEAWPSAARRTVVARIVGVDWSDDLEDRLAGGAFGPWLAPRRRPATGGGAIELTMVLPTWDLDRCAAAADHLLATLHDVGVTHRVSIRIRPAEDD